MWWPHPVYCPGERVGLCHDGLVVEEVTLEGPVVRLEPLALDHVDGLSAASHEDRSVYRWSRVPHGLEEVEAYVTTALERRDRGDVLPFAIVRRADERIVGSTRFFDVAYWRWPGGHPEHGRATPDVCEIGYTWLARSAMRTSVNTDAKRLLLTHAFETWRVHRVRFRTDVRNDVSRRAIERLGATLDGVLRGDRPGADGIVRDSALYAITADEWPAVRSRLGELLARPMPAR